MQMPFPAIHFCWKLLLVAAFVLFGLAAPASAQTSKPSISVRANRDSIGMNGSVQVQVEIKNARPRNFQFPELQGLSVHAGPNVASQTSVYNGQMTSSTTYTYLLKPLEIGSYEIPAMTIQTDRGELVSAPVPIAVVPDELVPFEPKRPAPQRRGWPFYNEPPRKKYEGRSHRL